MMQREFGPAIEFILANSCAMIVQDAHCQPRLKRNLKFKEAIR